MGNWGIEVGDNRNRKMGCIKRDVFFRNGKSNRFGLMIKRMVIVDDG